MNQLNTQDTYKLKRLHGQGKSIDELCQLFDCDAAYIRSFLPTVARKPEPAPQPRTEAKAKAGPQPENVTSKALPAAPVAAAHEAPGLGSEHYVTVVTTTKPCGKVVSLGKKGLEFTTSGSVVAGRGQVHHVPTPGRLLALLESLTDHQYIMPDYHPATVDRSFVILTQADHARQWPQANGAPSEYEGQLCVTLNKTEWRHGNWRVLDRDVDPNTPAWAKVPYAQWLELVEKLLPGLGKAPRVFWPSSKTRVGATSLNGHTWVDCTGVEHTKVLKARFGLMASELNLDWYVKRTSRKTGEELSGKGMQRTLFDLAVWSPHQILYAGSPTVGEGVTLAPPKGVATDGLPVDLLQVPEATAARVRAYGQRAGVSASLKRDGTVSIVDSTSLTLEHEVELEDGRVLTLAALLRDGKTEFDVKYRCQAILRDSSSMNGFIYKYRTGDVRHYDNGVGVTYFLAAVDVDFICTAFLSEGDEAALGSALASMRPGNYERERAAICKRLDMRIGVLDKLRSGGRPSGHAALLAEQQAEMFEAALDQCKANEPRDLTTLTDGEELLVELSAHWYAVLNTNKTIAATFFLKDVDGGSLLDYRAFNPGALHSFLAPYPLRRDKKLVSVAEVWMESKHRKSATRISFEPGYPRMQGSELNLWTGWPVEPVYNGDCHLFLQHIDEVISGGCPQMAEYFKNWLAKRVQGIYNRKPGMSLPRLGTTLVMRGLPGAGKGLFELYVQRLFGAHALVTSRGSGLTGSFNWQFANLVLLCADEAFFAGSAKEHDSLKSYITEPWFTFEQKGIDAVSLPNHSAVIMSTNHDWAVPADAGDRRMCVTEVAPHRKGDKAYFDALIAERDSGGPAALLGYLLKRDITGFDVGYYPRTEALVEQQVQTIASKCATFAWLQEALDTGKASGITPYPWTEAPMRLPRTQTGDAVRKVAAAHRHYTAPTNDVIGRALQKYVGHTGRVRTPATTVEGTEDADTWEWELPGLTEARRRFGQYLEKGYWK